MILTTDAGGASLTSLYADCDRISEVPEVQQRAHVSRTRGQIYDTTHAYLSPTTPHDHLLA